MGEGFVGPLPYTQRPEQPAFRTWATNWSAWDVPRIWDMVRAENNPNGWEQVEGFAQLSGVLFEYYRKLRSHREALHNAWRSPVGEQMVDVMMDPFAKSLLSESNCARETAAGLHGIMTTMADAKREIAPLLDRWNTVTIDWIPSWWIPEAGILNHKAQQIMRETEKAISDYRQQIVVPQFFRPESRTADDSLPPPPLLPRDDPADAPLIPPIPGHRPIIGEPVGFEGVTEAELASLPQPVLAVPGQPVSMLPIPPGSPHAPFGGAFILPGPGVGRAGYIVPMPPPGAGPGVGRGGGGGVSLPGGPARPGGIAPPGGAAGGMGMMPMPMNAPNAGGQGGSAIYRRRGDVVWPVAKGVPPMIQPVDDDAFVPDRPSEKQEEAFEDWFSDLAYPWRKDEDPANRPKITFRMVNE
jgi:hypothetical protein